MADCNAIHVEVAVKSNSLALDEAIREATLKWLHENVRQPPFPQFGDSPFLSQHVEMIELYQGGAEQTIVRNSAYKIHVYRLEDEGTQSIYKPLSHSDSL